MGKHSHWRNMNFDWPLNQIPWEKTLCGVSVYNYDFVCKIKHINLHLFNRSGNYLTPISFLIRLLHLNSLSGSSVNSLSWNKDILKLQCIWFFFSLLGSKRQGFKYWGIFITHLALIEHCDHRLYDRRTKEFRFW